MTSAQTVIDCAACLIEQNRANTLPSVTTQKPTILGLLLEFHATAIIRQPEMQSLRNGKSIRRLIYDPTFRLIFLSYKMKLKQYGIRKL